MNISRQCHCTLLQHNNIRFGDVFDIMVIYIFMLNSPDRCLFTIKLLHQNKEYISKTNLVDLFIARNQMRQKSICGQNVEILNGESRNAYS
jgi:hypothetical protein